MDDQLKIKARQLWEEVFPAGDEAALAEIITANSVSHPARPGERQGLEGAVRTMHWLRSVFSQQRWEIHRVIREGDVVVVHATHHGRHTGDLTGIAATGRQVAYDYVHVLRFEDGKVAEHWGFRDDLGLMRQLGALPAPAAIAAAG